MLAAHFLGRAFHNQNSRAIVNFQAACAFAGDDALIAGGRAERGDLVVEGGDGDFGEFDEVGDGGLLDIVAGSGFELPAVGGPTLTALSADELDFDVALLVGEADAGG